MTSILMRDQAGNVNEYFSQALLTKVVTEIFTRTLNTEASTFPGSFTTGEHATPAQEQQQKTLPTIIEGDYEEILRYEEGPNIIPLENLISEFQNEKKL